MLSAQPVLFIPALYCSPRLFEQQIPALWNVGPVQIANRAMGDLIAEIASQILATAPPRFALAGLSMGGYTAFKIMRQAPERVTRLALLDTSARADTAAAAQGRRDSIGLVVERADRQPVEGPHCEPRQRRDHHQAAHALHVRAASDRPIGGAFVRQALRRCATQTSRATSDDRHLPCYADVHGRGLRA